MGVIKFFIALLPIGALGDYMFHGAIYLHMMRTTYLVAMDQLSAQFTAG